MTATVFSLHQAANSFSKTTAHLRRVAGRPLTPVTMAGVDGDLPKSRLPEPLLLEVHGH